MNSPDAAWLHMDRPTNLMVVNSVLWFDEPVDTVRVKDVLRERLVEAFPRFGQRVAEPPVGVGIPYWEDDPTFDLDHHVHHVALPAPGDRAALQELVSDLITAPLDRSKPLWDVYLVDGFGSGMAMVVRIHHCIADGIALARVMLSLTDERPDAGFTTAAPRGGRGGRLAALGRPVATSAQLGLAALHEGLELLTHPRSELRGIAAGSAEDARVLAKLLLSPPDADTVLRGELGLAQRVAWSDGIPLAEVKRIGRATGTTVNDVLVAAMTGALRRYLAHRDSPADEIRAMVPFNVRPLDQPVPRELGNRFGLVELSLPVGISSSRERLAEVHRRMDRIKHSPEGALAYGILGLVGLTPRQVERRLIDFFTAKATAVLTNVPGPPQPVYFAGTEVAGALTWVPSSGSIGMGISIFSYNGGVTIGLRTDAGLVPDPERILREFERELRALGRLRPARPRKRSRERAAAHA